MKENIRKLLFNSVIFIGLFFVFGLIHELGHIIFGILGNDKIKSIGFGVSDNFFSLSLIVKFEYDMSTPEDMIFNFIGGYLLAIIVSSLVLVFSYRKRLGILVISAWFTLCGQISYMLLDSLLRLGDMANVFWYLDHVAFIEYNIYQFVIPLILANAFIIGLIFYLVNKLYLQEESLE